MNTAAVNKAWEPIWLGGLCDFVSGVTYSANEARAEPEPNYRPILRAGNIGETLDIAHDLVWVPAERVSSQQLLKADDIVMCMSSGSPEVVGKSARVDHDFNGSAGAFCCILRPRNHDASVFLAYWLKSSEFFAWRDSQARGANIQNLRASQLSKICIPLPPLAEQRRIAALLRAADEERRRRRSTQTLSDGLLGEVFTQLFGDPATNPLGWEWVAVDELKAKSKYSCVGGPFGSNLTSDDYVASPGVPVIRGTNINDASTPFVDDGFVYVADGKADTLTQNMAHPGDLVFTQRGTLGQVGYIPPHARFDRYVISQSQMKLTPNLDICDPWYLFHFFLTGYALTRIQASALTTGVPHINLDILKNFRVMLPPLALQRQFAVIVAEHERARRQQQESARQSDHLFAALLRRAFAGEL